MYLKKGSVENYVFQNLEECEKVYASLRQNELDEHYNSRNTDPIIYVEFLPMLKTAAETYTRRIFFRFEDTV